MELLRLRFPSDISLLCDGHPKPPPTKTWRWYERTTWAFRLPKHFDPLGICFYTLHSHLRETLYQQSFRLAKLHVQLK